MFIKVIILEQLLFLKFLNSSNKQKRVIEHTNTSTERNCKNNCVLGKGMLVPPKNHQSIYTYNVSIVLLPPLVSSKLIILEVQNKWKYYFYYQFSLAEQNRMKEKNIHCFVTTTVAQHSNYSGSTSGGGCGWCCTARSSSSWAGSWSSRGPASPGPPGSCCSASGWPVGRHVK